MSSILFDTASTSGNPAGTRNPSKAANDAAGGLSFDSFLAKTQSRHEASTALRSDRSESDRSYDKDRDDKTSRTEERDYKQDSTGRTDSLDDDYSRWDEEEDLATEAAESAQGYSETEVDDEDSRAEGSEVGAVQSDETANTATGSEAASAVAGAVANNASNTNTNASAGTNAPTAGAANTAANTPAAQGATPAAAAATAPQQAAAANVANGNQASKASTPKNSSTNASVSNNALMSQANTALTSGSAVVTLQSVDPKTGNPTGQTSASNTLASPQLDGKPDAAAEPKPVNAAAQVAKTPQQGAQGAQAPAVQAAAINSGTAPSIPANTSALPAGLADASAGVSAPQAAATSTGTPAFTSLVPVGGVTQTANATGAGAAASGNASASAAAPPPSDQVAVEIRKGIAAGKDSITIKLNPAELGKIDVKMEINDDGTLRATIAVEKSETLDLLQRDSRGLERALQNAGLQADSGSLNFSLSGQDKNSAEQFDTASNSGSGPQGDDTGSEDQVAENQQNSRSSHDGALDITV